MTSVVSRGPTLRRALGRVIEAVASHLPGRILRLVPQSRLGRAISSRMYGLLPDEVVIPHGAARGIRLYDPGRTNPGYGLGHSEPLVQEALTRYLEEGSVFVDVGAHVGFFTLIAARLVSAAGEVVAIEPYGPAVAALERNLELNGMTNVTIVKKAAGATAGSLRLEGDILGWTHAAEEGELVELVRLDDVLRASRPPTLIKIDVEGFELEVLRGLARTLSVSAPVVLCEVHGVSKLAEVEQLLRRYGYEVSVLEGEVREMPPPHLLAVPTHPATA